MSFKKIAICGLILTLGTVSFMGCGSKTETTEEEVEAQDISITPEEPELKTVGTVTDTAYQIVVKNGTELDIVAMSYRIQGEKDTSGNLLEEGDTFLAGEERILCIEPGEQEEVTDENKDEKLITVGYDVLIRLSDNKLYTLHSFPVEDMANLECEIYVEGYEAEKISGQVAYIVYDEISTKEAEIAVLEEAEEKRIAEEEAAKKKAEEEAAAAAAAAQKAAQQKAASKKKYSGGGSSGGSSQSSESCIGDAGLTY